MGSGSAVLIHPAVEACCHSASDIAIRDVKDNTTVK
jgi:hypothetical protein